MSSGGQTQSSPKSWAPDLARTAAFLFLLAFLESLGSQSPPDPCGSTVLGVPLDVSPLLSSPDSSQTRAQAADSFLEPQRQSLDKVWGG